MPFAYDLKFERKFLEPFLSISGGPVRRSARCTHQIHRNRCFRKSETRRAISSLIRSDRSRMIIKKRAAYCGSSENNVLPDSSLVVHIIKLKRILPLKLPNSRLDIFNDASIGMHRCSVCHKQCAPKSWTDWQPLSTASINKGRPSEVRRILGCALSTSHSKALLT